MIRTIPVLRRARSGRAVLLAVLVGMAAAAPFAQARAEMPSQARQTPFAFPTLTDAEPSTLVPSDPLVVPDFSGVARAFGATRAELSVNGDPFVQEADVRPGDSVRLRAVAPGQPNASDTAHLALGRREAVWMIVTNTVCTAPPEAFQKPGTHDILVPYGCASAVIEATAADSSTTVTAEVPVVPGDQATVVVGEPDADRETSVTIGGTPVIVAPAPVASGGHPPGWTRNGKADAVEPPGNGKGRQHGEGGPPAETGDASAPVNARSGSVSIRWR